MQEGMYYYWLYDKSNPAFFIQVSFRLHRELNIFYVEKSLNKLIKRHTILRTAFISEGFDRIMQVVFKDRKIDFYYKDIRKKLDKNNYIKAFKEKDKKRLFDLMKDVLIRTSILRVDDNEYEFIWSFHHILMDGWCIGLLVKEFFEIYNHFIEGKTCRLPEVKPYREYIKWIEKQDKKKSRNYWRRYLDGYEEKVYVPERTQSTYSDIEYHQVEDYCQISEKKTVELKNLAVKNNVTLNTLLQTVWGIILGKYNSKNDVVFGVVVSGRPSEIEGVELMFGLFINTIPMRIKFDKQAKFSELVNQIQTKFIESEQHSYYPLVEIQADNILKQELIDHILIFENYPMIEQISEKKDKNMEKRDHEVSRSSNVEVVEQTNYDFNVVVDSSEKINISFKYKKNRYDSHFVDRMSGHIKEVLNQISGNDEIYIKELTLLTQEEKQAILNGFNNNREEYPEDKTIPGLFERQAYRTPHHVALIYEEIKLTYGVLNERSNQIARFLRENGLQENQMVGILLNRSPLMVESILAVWKAGCAYIPVDLNPIDRIINLLEDSNVPFILSRPGYLDARRRDVYKKRIIELEENTNAGEIKKKNKTDLELEIGKNDMAYIIYTSGSTGKPKGAIVEHSGMLNHIYAKIQDLGLSESEDSIVAQNASHTFDISVWQFFAALVIGGKTVIFSDETVLDPELFISQIIKNRVTILELVPSYLSIMMENNGEWVSNNGPLPLKYLLVTGEIIKHNLVKKWFRIYPGIKMMNAYGPTEASDDITHYIMDKVPGMENIPIGKSLHNLNIYIVDENMKLCPVGVKGEICVSGVGVGRGYLNHSEKTIEVFSNDPFTKEDVLRLYKTGDVGCWLPDGTIDFFGRKDYQVKIRGFRIELGEIERKLLNYPGISDAVVMDKEDNQTNKYLCAYLVSQGKLNISEVKAHLSTRLPDYMIPSHFVELQAFPLTPNGKVDRKALPEPNPDKERGMTYISDEMLEELENTSREKRRGLSNKEIKKFLSTQAELFEKESLMLDNLSKAKGRKYYPLSHPQKMIYYTEKRYQGTSCENLIYVVKYPELIDPILLEKAINIVLQENEGLRLRIEEIEQESYIGAVQYAAPYEPMKLDTFDFSGDNGKELEQWLENNNKKAFRLVDNEIYWFAYIKFSEKESVYYFKFHHMFADGWTASLVATEINRIYEDLQAGHPIDCTPAPSYIHYILLEKDYLSSPRMEQEMAFWHRYMLPLPREVKLWEKENESENIKIEGSVCVLPFPGHLRTMMHDYCARHQTSLYKLILSALAIYISKVTGLNDFVVGTLNHNRSTESFKQTLGMFIRFIPLRIRFQNNWQVDHFVKEIGENVNNILKHHQTFPFDILANQIRGKTGHDVEYLYNVNLVGHPDIEKTTFKIQHHFPGYESTPLSIHINFSNRDIDGILELEWDYQCAKFSEPDIRQIHHSLSDILNDMLENPDRKLSQIECLSLKQKDFSFGEDGEVHPGRIEACLSGYPGIIEAAVVRRYNPNGESELRAFLTAEKKLNEPEIKEYLSARLPNDRMPPFFIQLETMPLNPNGQVNRNVLEEIDLKQGMKDEFKIPGNEIETKLVKIWSNVLGIETDQISIDANFFDLGGHSLKAVILVSKIHKELNTKVSVSEIFKTPTIKGLSEHIGRSKEEKFVSIKAVEKKEYYEISSAQKRLYISQQMELDSKLYNTPQRFILEDHFDIGTLESVFKQLILRHESLRTSFEMINGKPVQRVHEDGEFNIEYYDAWSMEQVTGNRNMKAVMDQFVRVFDLSQAPLLRAGLIKIGQNHMMVIDMHHIISDGVSHQALREEFLAMAANKGKKFPGMRIQYKDYTEWINRPEKQKEIERQEIYWLNRLDKLSNLELPLDYPRPKIQSFEGEIVVFTIGKNDTKALKKICMNEEITMYMLLLTILKVLLFKLTGQEDIAVASVISGRNHADLEKVVGIFLNVLVMRSFPRKEKTFRAFVKEVKKTTMEAFENQDCYFENLVEKLSDERDLSRNPLYDVSFTLQNFDTQSELEVYKDDSHKKEISNDMIDLLITNKITSKMDLNFAGFEIEEEEQFYLSIEYCVKLFKKETIEKFIHYFKNITSQIIDNPDIRLNEIELLSEDEKNKILFDIKKTRNDYQVEFEL
jgi:amino acid adenylation domain-containing protein